MSQQVGPDQIVIQMKLQAKYPLSASTRRAVKKAEAPKVAPTRPAGKLILEEKVVSFSPLPLIADFKKSGYRMIALSVEERGTRNSTHYMVRATFGLMSEGAVVSASFLALRDVYERDFTELLKRSIWSQLQAFENPVFEQGAVVERRYWVSVVLEGRKALWQPDGTLVTVWAKDANDERIGDAPLPLKPSYWLRLRGDYLEFEEAFQPKESVAA